MTTAVQLAQSVAPGVSLGFKNRIINGAMTIDQRNAGASVTITTNGTYTLDRWQAQQNQSSKFSVQQNAGSVTPPAGYTNYLGVTSLSAYTVGATDYLGIAQNIEGFNIADFGWGTASASPVTLSFWVRSSLTGTFGGALNNSGAGRSYPFSFVINAANTWEQKTITIAGDTSGTWLTTNGIGITLTFGLGNGTTRSGTAGAWASAWYQSATGATSVVGTNGATFYITGVQLEKGTAATNFEFRDYGREFAMCQRYYEVSYAGWVSSNSYPNLRVGLTASYAVCKRATPTVTRTTPQCYTGAWVNVSSPGTFTANTWGASVIDVNSATFYHLGTQNNALSEYQTWYSNAEL